MSGYILNREGIKAEEEKRLYRLSDLELMTTHQLREICRREKIIQGMINPMDKEELVHVIMRYRGTKEQRLIRHEKNSGRELLEQMLAQGRITAEQDKTLHIPSKMIVYSGQEMDEHHKIRNP